ncbi:hypothetical protein N1851_020074 [Merluccius polli]|uniref:Uncharacterized protein n=1 Tax=Merluccius polli TaxID=89951 RepID=A0AA47MKX0_MERPO|nr:hypothetical protein N1851_020074 [Merluccius polli]
MGWSTKYDVASVMENMQAVAKHAFYVHCHTHCLNFVLVDTVTSVPEAACFFTSQRQACAFTINGLKFSKKCMKIVLMREVGTGLWKHRVNLPKFLPFDMLQSPSLNLVRAVELEALQDTCQNYG